MASEHDSYVKSGTWATLGAALSTGNAHLFYSPQWESLFSEKLLFRASWKHNPYYTMKFYSTSGKAEVIKLEKSRWDLKGIILYEMIQTQKDKQDMFCLRWLEISIFYRCININM